MSCESSYSTVSAVGPCLIGEKCTLLPCEPADADALFEIIDLNRENFREFLGWLNTAKSAEDTRKFIECRVAEFQKREGAYFKIVVNGTIQGVISIQAVERAQHRAALGYWLSASLSGRGIMTEAASLITKYGFEEFGLHRIEIRCSTKNRASQRVAEKLGYTKEGVLKEAEFLYDHYDDQFVYGKIHR